jgi:hypothetical protein
LRLVLAVLPVWSYIFYALRAATNGAPPIAHGLRVWLEGAVEWWRCSPAKGDSDRSERGYIHDLPRVATFLSAIAIACAARDSQILKGKA